MKLQVCQWQRTASLTILWIFSPKSFVFSEARPLETYLCNKVNCAQYKYLHLPLGCPILISCPDFTVSIWKQAQSWGKSRKRGFILLFAEAARSVGQPTAPQSGATPVLHQNRVSSFLLSSCGCRCHLLAGWSSVLSATGKLFRL